MFKKREKPKARAREDAADGDGDQGSVPVFKKPRQGSSATASGGDGVNANGSIVASTRRGDADQAEILAYKLQDVAQSGFVANDSSMPSGKDDAFRDLQVDTDHSHDARAVLERNQAIHKGLKDGSLEKGIYRGIGAYKQYAERGEGAISNSKSSGQLGPVRAGNSNVRSTLRIEYIGTTGEGGICKDYKETGYCGFGDSCKFLHDRSDYKPSYILEKEWEDAQKLIQDKKRARWERRMKRKQLAGPDAEEPSDEDSDKSSNSGSDDEGLPSACPECHTSWEECTSTPVQTVCNHYFCEDCALRQFAVSTKCLTCDLPTNGIFNTCDALEEKVKQKKATALAKKQKKAELREPNRSTGYDIGLDPNADD